MYTQCLTGYNIQVHIFFTLKFEIKGLGECFLVYEMLLPNYRTTHAGLSDVERDMIL